MSESSSSSITSSSSSSSQLNSSLAEYNQNKTAFEQSLQALQVELQREQQSLQQERQDFEERSKERQQKLDREQQHISTRWKKMNTITNADPVTLNIGGTLFTASVETLTREKTLFTTLLSDEFAQQPDKQYFIDRDPKHFSLLLNYLRTGNLNIERLSPIERSELLTEAQYYEITSVLDYMNNVELSQDILQYISYNYLKLKDLYSMMCVNKRYYTIMNKNSCWYALCLRDFGDIPQEFKLNEGEDHSYDMTDNYKLDFVNAHYKECYLTLLSQWEFEKSTVDDFEVEKKIVRRSNSRNTNPMCLTTRPFLIREHTSSKRVFGNRSYFEVKITNCRKWSAVGAVGPHSVERSGNNVLGNLPDDIISIGYYGDSGCPTINLNGEILSGCEVSSFQEGDIVGVHLFSITNSSCLTMDDPKVTQYRNEYIERKVQHDWKVFAALYLNGKLVHELPIMQNSTDQDIYPAVCIGYEVVCELQDRREPRVVV
jgi:hypothetical protein